jgi:hypothetical protein
MAEAGLGELNDIILGHGVSSFIGKWRLEHPTIRRLTSLRRHQLLPIALIARIEAQFHLPAERTEIQNDWHYQSTDTPKLPEKQVENTALIENNNVE